jgi:hypothetical protein
MIRISLSFVLIYLFVGNMISQKDIHIACAEASTVKVYGTVTDSTNVRLPHANVMFITGTDTTRAFSDSTGYYELILYDAPGIHKNKKPGEIILSQNYPNPFNPSTLIQYTVNEYLPVKLDIYSITGQKIKSLVNDYETSGMHSVVWDGRDNGGNGVGAGVYLYQLKAGTQVVTKKMLLLDGTFGHSPSSQNSKAPSVEKRTNILADKVYDVIAEKSTMKVFKDIMTITFDEFELKKDIVLPDTYRPFGLFFDTSNYNNEFIYPGESFGLTLVGIHEEKLPTTCQVTLTSRTGDQEMITLSGSSVFIRKFGNCILENSYYSDSRRGTIVSSSMTPIQGNGIMEVNAHSDTVNATITFSGGISIKSSIAVVDSVDFIILWGRKYVSWKNDWFFVGVDGKWELVGITGIEVTFISSVTENEISEFIINNDIDSFYKINEYQYYFRLNDSTNAIQFLINNKNNNLINDTLAPILGCVAN